MVSDLDVDPWSLSLAERIGAVRDIERDIARLQARQVRLIAAIAADPCSGFPSPYLVKEMVKEELRAVFAESAISWRTGSRRPGSWSSGCPPRWPHFMPAR